MDPQTNTNPNADSNPAPSQPATPQDTGNNPASATNNMPSANGASYPPRSSKKKIIFIIVGIIAALLVAGSLYIYMLGKQVFDASNNFMGDITTGKVDEAVALTNGASKESLTAAATATKGGFTYKDQAATTVGERKIVYLLYDLQGANAKQARTALEKLDGKWKVISFVYGDSLRLVPENSDSQNKAATEPTSGGSCLVASDFDSLYKAATGVDRPANRDYTKINYNGNFHFNPDGLDFAAPVAQNTDKVGYYADFIKQNSSKDFTVHLKGSVATTTQSDLNFARQRAEKVRDLLVAQGASASHIVIDQPGNVDDMGSGASSNSASQRSARSVVLTIDAACTASDDATDTGR